MKKLDCQCCGAALPIPERYQKYVKCKYCDATYEIEEYEKPLQSDYVMLQTPHYVMIQPGHIQKLGAKVHLDEYQVRMYPPELIKEQVRHRLAEEIMEYLEKELQIYEDINIFEVGRTYSTMIYLDTRSFR